MSNNTHTFRELLPNKKKQIFRVDIKHYWHFEGVTPKQFYTLLPTSSNTDIFRELLSKNTTLFQSLHQTILNTELLANNTKNTFPELTSEILTFSESYWQTILHTFPEFIPSNTDVFREFLLNEAIVKNFFKVHITQYWHFQRATTKQYWLI